MAYEYVSREKRDSGESMRVLSQLESSGLRAVAVTYRPETNSTVIYFARELSEEEKEKLDRLMAKIGYMVTAGQ